MPSSNALEADAEETVDDGDADVDAADVDGADADVDVDADGAADGSPNAECGVVNDVIDDVGAPAVAPCTLKAPLLKAPKALGAPPGGCAWNADGAAAAPPAAIGPRAGW